MGTLVNFYFVSFSFSLTTAFFASLTKISFSFSLVRQLFFSNSLRFVFVFVNDGIFRFVNEHFVFVFVFVNVPTAAFSSILCLCSCLLVYNKTLRIVLPLVIFLWRFAIAIIAIKPQLKSLRYVLVLSPLQNYNLHDFMQHLVSDCIALFIY